MSIASYLPSSQFSVVVASIAAAGGLIVGAQYITRPQNTTPQLSAAPETAVAADWEASLAQVQATQPGLPEAPSEDTVAALIKAAKSDNLTDTVARTLLINLSSASAQGLGADIPTQDKIVALATQAAAPPQAKKTYTQSDLILVDNTPQTQKAYGNAVMTALGKHTEATSNAVLLAVSLAIDNNNPAELSALIRIQTEYEGLVEDLAAVSVPKTFAPLYLQSLNSLGAVAASVEDLQKILNDPLRGLQALKQYQSKLGEVGRVFTSIAEALGKNGILFNKDEPGAAWEVFTSP